jgi:hypothetical protein
MGGPGVQRSVQLCRYLPEFGYQPVVLTLDEKSIDTGRYTKDESLNDLLPPGTIICREPSREPLRFTNLMKKIKIFRLFWFLLYPIFWERSALWPFAVYGRAKKLIREHDISIVYTSSGPFSSLILGYLLRKKMEVKWVADLRDPFTDAYAWSFPSRMHWRIMRFFEKIVLEVPDVLVVNTEAVKKLYERRGIRNGKIVEVISNGY